MSKNYSHEVADAIKDFFVQDDWSFSFDEEKGIFRLGVGMKGQIKTLSYIVNVGNDAYTVYATSPIGADAKDGSMMAILSEFICRANYGLRNGNFELDCNDGEIRYKVFVDCDGIVPTKAIVQDSIHCPAGMFQRYESGIIGIIFNGLSAKEAIDKSEKPSLEALREFVSSHPEMAELAANLGLDAAPASEGEEAGSSEIGNGGEEVNMELFGTSTSQ